MIKRLFVKKILLHLERSFFVSNKMILRCNLRESIKSLSSFCLHYYLFIKCVVTYITKLAFPTVLNITFGCKLNKIETNFLKIFIFCI